MEGVGRAFFNGGGAATCGKVGGGRLFWAGASAKPLTYKFEKTLIIENLNAILKF